MEGKEKKPYKIVAAYDTETNNLYREQMRCVAFPVLHQFGFIDSNYPLSLITSTNVEEVVHVDMVRHSADAFAIFDTIISTGKDSGIVPVVMVHNLGFDIWSLSSYLSQHECKVLAKSATKPVTITILDDGGNPALVLWDTLGFFGKPLEKMGNDCGYPKLVGSWDYDRQRTPYTELTEREIAYAEHDIYTLFAYIGYYLRQNPDIPESKLALNIVTKTSAVRYKRIQRFDQMRGYGLKKNVGRMWLFQNRKEQPKTNEELFTMHACTRGGFTFCSRNWAGFPFDLTGTNYRVVGYDATSQHPAQMVSHLYPEDFHETKPETLTIMAEVVCMHELSDVLEHWEEPFPMAFNAAFRFTNLRLKAGSIFEENGIAPLAWARVRNIPWAYDEENQNGIEFQNFMQEIGYQDWAVNPEYSFGKIEACQEGMFFLTELEMWVMAQCYDWDTCEAVEGYSTGHFCKPTDMMALSVMQFYHAKNVFKHYKELYDRRESLGDTTELRKYVPAALVDEMEAGTASDTDVSAAYQILKSDLNALFGIEATNEAKRDMVISDNGIISSGEHGVQNLPQNPKADYQTGQRIVGWSRVAQVVTMLLAAPYVDGIVNGDTDSVKFYMLLENVTKLDSALKTLADAIDRGREKVTARIRNSYPDYFADLSGIGHYVREFEAERFAASWNKAYAIQEYDKKFGELRFKFTLAGITTAKKYTGVDDSTFDNSLNAFADYLYHRKGWDFAQIVSLLLGYNVTIDPTITKQHMRTVPQWGAWIKERVTDWKGDTYTVEEPYAMALCDMSKEIGNTSTDDNYINAAWAKRNNPAINTTETLLIWEPFQEPIIMQGAF